MESHLLKYFWMMGTGIRFALTMRVSPVFPVNMWKNSSFSMAETLRASGAKAEWLSMVSWNLPSRSTNWV